MGIVQFMLPCLMVFYAPVSIFFGETDPILSISPFLDLTFQDDCQASLDQLTQSEDWFDQMVNPVLMTTDQIGEKYALYLQIHQCFEEDFDSLPEELQVIYNLSEYFLVFAGGYKIPDGETALALVDPATTDDKAIVQIRDEAAVSPPDGFFYVRFFSSRSAMPRLVQSAFEDPDTKGVTILMRYIAVLTEDEGAWEDLALESQTLPKTISHELVHAYVNSLTGLDNLKQVPTWYDEGVAIYFSESGKDHTVVGPTFRVYQTSPRDYKQYDTNFKYLEKQLGRKQLLELIKQSIEASNPSILYENLGLTDEKSFFSAASKWKMRKDYTRMGLGLTAVVLLIIGVAIWYKRFPDAWCVNCDYGGKREKFVNGICPRCQYPYNERTE